jgi:hypothetical protein
MRIAGTKVGRSRIDWREDVRSVDANERRTIEERACGRLA